MTGTAITRRRWFHRLVTVGVIAYALAMLGVLALVQCCGDRTPLGMLVLFGPRHLMPLPWIILTLAALPVSRRLALVSVLGALVTAVGVGGFELPLPGPASEPSIRVVHYNTDRSRALAWRIRQDLAAWDADVVAMLDCKTEVMDSLRAVASTRFIESDFNCLVTKFPVLAREQIPGDFPGLPSAQARGHRGLIEKYTLDADGRRLTLYVLHFQSPRDALGAVRYERDLSRLPESYMLRGLESRAASRWVDRGAPGVLVVGDFNMTSESQIFRGDWGDLTDVFGRIGFGFGHTMIAGKHRVRIDHVLTGDDLAPARIEVLRGFPSEHQPVVVDLAWR